MDLITQGLLGATVAAAGFRARLGPRALVVGALLGVAPDLDVLAGLAGDWASLVHHRGLSHSLVVLSMLAPPLGWALARCLGEGEDTRAWMGLSFWALVTHPLLDLFTSFGTQLFAPLSDARFALDGVGALDLLISVPLALAVFAGGGRGWARAALVWSLVYLAGGCALSNLAARDVGEQLRAEGFELEARRALVAPLLPLTRRVVARDRAGHVEVVVWSALVGSTRRATMLRPDDARVDAALHSERGQVFEWFADGYLVANIEPRGAGARVTLSDARFGGYRDLGGSYFRLLVDVDDDGQLLRAELGERPRMAFVAELREAWSLTLGRTETK